jgi:hypothetical protein
MTTYMPSSSKLPRLTAELQPRLRAEGRPTTRVAPKTSEAVRARYIALRITGLDEISTAHALELSTAASAALETILCGRDLSAARKRHQAGDSVRGKNAEIKYLREETGTELAEHLARCPPALVKALSDALQPRRSPGYRLPDIETLRSDLLRLATCLPASLALLVQFHLGQLSSADRARLQNEKGRVFVGDPDRDLGSRPRVSVIETACPLNPVGRARRTANVRCVIAALDLVRSFPGSNNT